MIKRTGIAVVCRLNSKRLPRKALLQLGRRQVIEWCLQSACDSRLACGVTLATSTNAEDDELCRNWIARFSVGYCDWLRGSEDDVADRILDVARRHLLDNVARVTGDSPLLSSELMDMMISAHETSNADYTYVTGAPLGTRAEVISVQALKRLQSLVGTDASEYLSLYFKSNRDHFSVQEFAPPAELQSDARLNLDYPEDYEVLQRIFNDLSPENPPALRAVLAYLESHPEVKAINSAIKPRYENPEFKAQLDQLTRITK